MQRRIPPMKRLSTPMTLLAVVAPALLLVALPALAAVPPNKRHESVYRCRDAHGHIYAGQAIPEECMGGDIEVLDQNGRLVRVIPGRAALQEAAAQQAAEEARIAASNRDRTLIATYLSVEDIERLRDQRVDMLAQQAHVTQQYVANLEEREARLVQEVQRFRPYSAAADAPVLPDHIGEDIVNTVNGLQVYQEELARNTAEQDKLRSEFDADITRFKQLKGIK
jgi:hypothetical protein